MDKTPEELAYNKAYDYLKWCENLAVNYPLLEDRVISYIIDDAERCYKKAKKAYFRSRAKK